MSAIELDENGEMVRDRGGFTRISDIPQIAQDVQWSMHLRMGEIPTNRLLGIDWLGLLELGAPETIIGQKVQEHLLTRAGVTSATVTASIDGTTRVASVAYQAFTSLADLRRRTVLNETVSVLI